MDGNYFDLLKNFKLDKSEEIVEIKEEIFKLVKKYAQLAHTKKEFSRDSNIPVSGKVFDENEIISSVAASLDFWLTTDRFNDKFEKMLKEFLDVKFCLTTNSGSSANLLALTALTSEELGERALKPGDEVITTAACFPTTVNPIIQNNLTPVFLDIDIETYNVNLDDIEESISEKTKAIMIAHTLGNPFSIDKILEIKKKYNLWLIEDCCDALGSTYNDKKVGTFGDIGTFSFYPAHQITMGEGGALVTSNPVLRKLIESFRDWGRDCFCAPGVNNTCGKRFCWQLGDLPTGYDHKYIYSHVGYNLKITEMQAAIGIAQMMKVENFIKSRKENFEYLSQKLNDLQKFLVLPKATDNSEPAWFGFPITVKSNAGFSKNKILEFLGKNQIDTRPLFAGNVIKQPYFKNIKYKTNSKLTNVDLVMNNTFWIGTFPGIEQKMMDKISEKMHEFCMQF